MNIIYPPRPKGRIDPRELDYYEGTGMWLIQYKYNGTRNLVNVSADRKVSVWSRHGGKHLAYSLPNNVRDEILALPGLEKGKEYWLDSELLSKTSATETKNKLVFYDVLHAGVYLFGKPTQTVRLEMLDEICGKPRILDPWRGMGYKISDTLMMAPTFANQFKQHFLEKIIHDECEGLVLRRKDSVLDNFGKKEYEVGWVIRCRKPHKNYNF